MLKTIAGWLLLVPLFIVLVAVALANRHLVALNLNPFVPADPASAGAGVPLFLVLYVTLLLGVLLGGTATWISQGRHRRREKHWRREAAQLNEELTRLRRKDADPAPHRRYDDVDDLLGIR